MADGSVIIDTRVLTDGFEKGALNMKDTFGRLAAGAKKLGAAIGLAFGAKQIINFAKESIDLGSDLQEVQNVVDVTFTTMNEQVNEFAKNAMFTAGLSETMAKRYIGTFGAMSKSFGFNEKEALDMSTAMTQLTGDVASFYNLSQDLAYTKLKGVFTGETEGLKDLGIVMTQSALDQYALANGFGKTTDKMTEQEKVALRYQFVLNGLSTASGDYLRTSKSWANQTKLLSLQMDQLKATIGQGLINALTPVIQVINNVIAKLQDFANAFRSITAAIFGDASGGDESISGGLGEAAENADDLGQNIEDAGKTAKKATAGFDEIQKLSGGADAGSSGGGGGSAPETTPQKYVLGGEVVDELSPKLQEIIDSLKTLFDDVKTKAEEMFSPLKEIDFGPMKDSLSGLWDSIETWLEDSGEDLEWAWNNIFVPLAGWVVEEAGPASIDALSAAIEFLTTVGEIFEPVGTWLWDNFLKPVASWSGDKAVEGLNALSSVLTKLTAILNGELSFSDFISNLSLMESGALSVVAAFTPIIGGPLLSAIAGIGSIIASNWDSIIQGFEEDWEVFKWWFTTQFIGPWVEAFSGAGESIKTAWSGVKTWFKDKVAGPIGTAFSNAGTKIKEKFNSAKSALKNTSWTDVKTWFKDKVAAPIGTSFSNAASKIRTKFSDARKALENNEGWQNVKAFFKDKVAAPIGNTFTNAASKIRTKFSDARKALENNEGWQNVKAFFKDKVAAPIGTAFSNASTKIKEKFNSAKSALKNTSWTDVKTWFKDKVAAPIGTAFSNASTNIKNKFSSAKSALKNTSWTDVKTWFKDKVASPIGTAFGSAATTIKNKFSSAKKSIKSAWESVSTWFKDNVSDPIKGMFNNIFEKVKGFFDVEVSMDDFAANLGDKFKEFINDMIDALNSLLSKVITPFNNIIKKLKEFKVLGATPFAGLTTIPVPSIPQLAKGAVIPPNAPFLAMLGDQRTGTNVEAPLSTIQEALANVMAEYGGGDVTINFTGDLAQLGRVLKPVIDRENKRRGGTLAKGTI